MQTNMRGMTLKTARVLTKLLGPWPAGLLWLGEGLGQSVVIRTTDSSICSQLMCLQCKATSRQATSSVFSSSSSSSSSESPVFSELSLSLLSTSGLCVCVCVCVCVLRVKHSALQFNVEDGQGTHLFLLLLACSDLHVLTCSLNFVTACNHIYIYSRGCMCAWVDVCVCGGGGVHLYLVNVPTIMSLHKAKCIHLCPNPLTNPHVSKCTHN